MKTDKVVLIQGAFEIINYGHCRMFRRLKQLAGPNGIVIVALNTNKLLKQYKKRDAVLPWWQKKFILESIQGVGMVIAAHNASPLSLLKKHRVDTFCLTREWEKNHTDSIAYMKHIGGSVYFSPRYAGVIPTSEIKRRLLEEAKSVKG